MDTSPNFDFLTQEFPPLAESASFAELHIQVDPRAACFHDRYALGKICDVHPRDVASLQQEHVRDSFLFADGQARAATYRLPNRDPIDKVVPEFDVNNSSRSSGTTPVLNICMPAGRKPNCSGYNSSAGFIEGEWSSLASIAGPVSESRSSSPDSVKPQQPRDQND